jgi:hypothetical protein
VGGGVFIGRRRRRQRARFSRRRRAHPAFASTPSFPSLLTANSCSPCKRIEPAYASLRHSFDGSGVRFARAVCGEPHAAAGAAAAPAPPALSSPWSSSADDLASDLQISTLPTWVCLRGGGGQGGDGGAREVARVEGVRHKRPLQPVAAAVRRRLLLLPPEEEQEEQQCPPAGARSTKG